MSCNPNAPLELAAANRSLQRQEESRTECLLGHFAALQGSPLPDCCCENPDRACRSERSGNAAASWCKTNSLFMLECRSLFSLSRKIREFKHARSQAINVPAVVADSSRQRIIIPTRPRIIIVPCRLLLTPPPRPDPPGGRKLTLGEARRVVVDVGELDGDGGGPGESAQVSPHVLGLEEHQVLVLRLSVHVRHGRAQDTCQSNEAFRWRNNSR